MDTGLHYYCNRDLLRGIKEMRGKNVMLLLLDGSIVFGNIGGVDECTIGVLPAAGLKGVNAVRLRPPNPTMPCAEILLSEMLIDACNVAGVVEGPFSCSPVSRVCTATFTDEAISPGKPLMPFPRQHLKLLADLKEFEGQNMGVLLVGGWVFGGQLSEVGECLLLFGPGTSAALPLITIGALTVFGPALPGGYLSMFGTFRAWVNSKPVVANLFP